MKAYKIPGEALLTLTALVWGFGFAAQALGMEHVGEFTLIGLRNLLAAAALIPFVLINDKRRSAPVAASERAALRQGGLITGVIVFMAGAAQQFAISYTDAGGGAGQVGKVSFLTSMYMVLVPALGVFFGRKSGAKTWVSVLIGCAGMYLLCGLEGGMPRFTRGDAYAVLCAGLYALQIIAIDKFAPNVDCVRLSQYQFAVCGVLAFICALIFEEMSLESVWAGRWAIIYLGLASSGVGYTLQTIGQKRTRPQLSSLIMCLESVFGALAGYLILGERLSVTQLCGSALMLLAVVYAQLDFKRLSIAR